MSDTITRENARAAMEAHTNLNALGAIIALCENSLFFGERAQRLEDQIATLCRKEQATQLAIMEKAMGAKHV